jgi:hypothetical protein
MYAEAFKQRATLSKRDSFTMRGPSLTCDECDVEYKLYYDGGAEPSFTSFNLLAGELITARHPLHRNNIFLHCPGKNP